MGLSDWYARSKDRLAELFATYGKVAIGTLIVVRVTELAVVWGAIEMGFQPESAAGTAGTFWAAMAVTQGTKPFRIGFVVIATPIIARLLGQDPLAVATGSSSPPGRSPASPETPAGPPVD